MSYLFAKFACEYIPPATFVSVEEISFGLPVAQYDPNAQQWYSAQLQQSPDQWAQGPPQDPQWQGPTQGDFHRQRAPSGFDQEHVSAESSHIPNNTIGHYEGSGKLNFSDFFRCRTTQIYLHIDNIICTV